jgi:ankyrin repeat protein
MVRAAVFLISLAIAHGGYTPHPLVAECVDKKLDPADKADKCASAMLHVKNNHECHRLLEQGHDADARLDEEGRTKILLATIKGQKDIVAELLNFGKADPKIKAKAGHTALMYAAGGGHTDLMNMFFAAGVTVDDVVTGSFMPDGVTRPKTFDPSRAMVGSTALHFACKFGRLRATAMLLDNGADREAKDHAGKTPLQVALANAPKKETRRKFQRLFDQFDEANKQQVAIEAARLDKNKKQQEEEKEEKKDEL